MNPLQAAAVEAVEKAHTDTEFAGSTKLKALKFLRDETGLSLPECIPAIEYAMARPRTTLTRADKERAVKELASRLEGISENRAYADAGFAPLKPSDVKSFARRQELLNKALVRLAMARTVD